MKRAVRLSVAVVLLLGVVASSAGAATYLGIYKTQTLPKPTLVSGNAGGKGILYIPGGTDSVVDGSVIITWGGKTGAGTNDYTLWLQRVRVPTTAPTQAGLDAGDVIATCVVPQAFKYDGTNYLFGDGRGFETLALDTNSSPARVVTMMHIPGTNGRYRFISFNLFSADTTIDLQGLQWSSNKYSSSGTMGGNGRVIGNIYLSPDGKYNMYEKQSTNFNQWSVSPSLLSSTPAATLDTQAGNYVTFSQFTPDAGYWYPSVGANPFDVNGLCVEGAFMFDTDNILIARAYKTSGTTPIYNTMQLVKCPWPLTPSSFINKVDLDDLMVVSPFYLYTSSLCPKSISFSPDKSRAYVRINYVNDSSRDNYFMIVGLAGQTPPNFPPTAPHDNSYNWTTYTSAKFTWLAPWDDNNRANKATAYEVRYSTNPIVDEASWSAAMVFTPDTAITPASPGSSNTVTISGLQYNTHYWMSVRASDDFGNWSPLSTPTVEFDTQADVTPPSTITDLAISDAAGDSIELTWTAPADDWGNNGDLNVQAYDIRYSTTAIVDDATFLAAAAVSTPPSPQANGSVESFTLSGLVAGTKYYVAIRSQDSGGNWSAISNIAALDSTPPNAIADLAASGRTSGSITLGWTSPADPDDAAAASYNVRYSTTEITDDASFDLATEVAGVPAPAASGTAEALTVSGLSEGTVYYFAIRSADAADNVSLLSNVLSLKTLWKADIDHDGSVNLADLKLLVAAWNSVPESPNWNPNADIDGDGSVNLADLKILVSEWNNS